MDVTRIEKAKKFLQHFKSRVLERLMTVYLKGRRIALELTVGGRGSYTNGTKLTVDVTYEEAEEMSFGDLTKIAKFKSYHEASHVRFTDNAQYEKVAQDMTQIWVEDAKDKGEEVNFSQLYKFAYKLLNAICDGRIENILVTLLPGLRKLRDWYRLGCEWQSYKDVQRSPLMEVFNNILTIATCGLYCKGFDKKFSVGTTERDIVDRCIEPISTYVSSDTIMDGRDAAVEIAKNISDLVIDAYKNNGSQMPQDLSDMMSDDADNNNFNRDNTSEKADNSLVIGILTDDSEEGEDSEDGVKPDIIIDLRKNPPKPNQKDEEEESENGSSGSGSEQESDSENESENSNSQNSKSTFGDLEKEEKEEDKDGGEGSSESDSDKESDESSESNSSSKGSEEDSDQKEEEKSGDGTDDNSEKDSDNNSKGKKNSSKNQSKSEDSKESEDISSSEKEDKAKGESKEGHSSLEQLNSLMANAEAFEKAIEERLRAVAEDLANQVAREIQTTNASIEASDKVEESNKTLLTESDQQLLRDEGFLGRYTNDIHPNKIEPYHKGSKLPIEIKNRGSQTRNTVENIIASQQEMDREDVYSGELNEAALGKFICGRGDIFRMEGEEKEPSLAVYIAKDDSGSMYGHKENMACEALAEIEEVFKPLVPLKITTFTERYFDVIKEWDDKDSRSYTWDFHREHEPDGGNDDALAIMNGAMQLLKRPEEKKLLIIISDGLPCCSPESVHKAVEWARKNGIFVISFFIGNEREVTEMWPTFKAMYTRYFCGVNPKILGTTLCKFLRNFIEE